MNYSETGQKKYKTLYFSDIQLNKIELDKVNLLFNKYPQNEVSYTINNTTFIVYLKSINLTNFKNDVVAMVSDGLANTNAGKLLEKILCTIIGIKSYGIKGEKRIYTRYDEGGKVKNRKQKEQNRERYFYVKNHNFSSKNNLFPEKYINQIVCSDSEAVMRELPDNCIDIIFTSPPYNFGLEYNLCADDHHWQSYFNKLFIVFDECVRILKYSGRIIINVQPLFSDYIPTHHIISNYFINKKMIWKGEILWKKNNYNCKYTAWGSWKSPSSPYLKYTWEFLEIFAKGTLKKNGSYMDADISADEFKKWVLAEWNIAPEKRMREYGHPAMFPEELASRILKLFSFKNDVVVDPFNGVGTTTFVAKKLNRNYLGIDISEEYCKIANKRLNLIIF